MKVRSILLGAFVMFAAAAAMAAETYQETFAKGLKEYKARKYKEAAVTLSAAVGLAGSPSEKYNSMIHQGEALERARKYSEAQKVFQNLLEVEELSPKQKDRVFAKYLNTFYRSNNHKEVIAIAEKTLADEKASVVQKSICASLAAQSSRKLRKYTDMEKYAKKLVELNPKGAEYNNGIIYHADALVLQKKYEAADKLLSKDVIASMHPYTQGRAYFKRGELKAAMGKHEDAVAEYAAIYENPKGYRNHKDQAVVFAIARFKFAGKLEDAEVWIKRVDTIKNLYWKTRGMMRAAQVLQKNGKLKEAKAKWMECQKSGPWYKKQAEKQIAIIDKKLNSK